MHPLTTHILLFKLFSYHSPMEATILLDILPLQRQINISPDFGKIFIIVHCPTAF